MVKGSMRSTIFTRLYCRNSMPPPSPLSFPENRSFLRHCHSQPVDTVQKVSKANSIKIGNKIYVVKTKGAWTNLTGEKPSKQVKRRQNPSDLKNPPFVSKPKRNTSSVKESVHLDQHHFSSLKRSEKIDRNSSTVSSQSANVWENSLNSLEFSSTFQQSIYCKENSKPFLTESARILSSPDRDYPSSIGAREILTQTRSPASVRNISHWKETKLLKLGPEGFTELEEELKQSGLDFQNMIMEYLKSGDSSLAAVSPVMEAYWESIAPTLRKLENPQCFQEKFWHPHFNYVGTVDCIATYRGKPAIIEFKKGSYPKDNFMGIEACIGLIANCGAFNADPSSPYQIQNAVLIYAHADGSPANVHEFSNGEIQLYWKLWLRRLYHFQQNHSFTNKKNNLDLKNGLEDEKFPPESTNLKSDSMEKATSPIKEESHINIYEEASLQSCVAETRELENVTLSKPVDNQSDLAVENEDSCGAKPELHDQISQEEMSETTEKSQEKRGFFKSLWNMWK